MLGHIARAVFDVHANFTLPPEAWMDDFYTPMRARIGDLRQQYAGDAEALAALDQAAPELAMHERYGHHYAYKFFLCQRPG